MKDPCSKGTGPPRAPTRTRRAKAAALAVLGLCLGSPPDEATATSLGVQMRRARFALARGADAAAVIDLDSVRRAEPGSARGLEAALLLADLSFSSGRPDRAAVILDEASRAAPEASATPIQLARGWLAVSRGRHDRARDRFDDVRDSSSAPARAVAEIGRAWSFLAAGSPAPNVAALSALARSDSPLPVRFAAGWTVARSYAASGQGRRGLRALRRLRRDVRDTTYEDDLELMLGLAQLDAGRARDARRTFKRLERRHGSGASRSPLDAGLRLADLRAPNAELVTRVSSLYANRSSRAVGLLPFLAALVDRPAALDATAAAALADRMIAAQRGDYR